MAAPSETYVDPSIAGNSGTGTIGDPYGDLQYALDTMTRDSTNGDRINIKSGTAEVLTGAIDLTNYGSPSSPRTAPLILSGYDSTAGDGGIGEIDGNGSSVYNNASGENIYFIDLKMGNCGTSDVIRAGRFVGCHGCEVYGTTANGIKIDNGHSHAVRCWVHDIGDSAVRVAVNGCCAIGCYFSNDGTRTMTQAVKQANSTSVISVINNFFSLDSTSNGVFHTDWGIGTVIGNSFLTSGTGTAVGSASLGSGPVINNLFEGFSQGIDTYNSGPQGVRFDIQHNAFYDCTTNITSDNDIVYAEDNESLGASPFAKTGSLPTDFTSASFWSDLYAYFAPVDTGNVYSGFPVGSNQTKGAVGQPVGGGAGGGLLRVNMNGNVFG